MKTPRPISPRVLMEKEKKEKEDELIREYVNMTCAFCSFVSKTFNEANNHSKKVHKRRAYLMCCSRKIYRRSIALEHIATHKNPDAFKYKFNMYLL